MATQTHTPAHYITLHRMELTASWFWSRHVQRPLHELTNQMAAYTTDYI